MQLDPAMRFLGIWDTLGPQIFEFLEPRVVQHDAAVVSSNWLPVAQDESLWFSFCRRRWKACAPTVHTAKWLSCPEEQEQCGALREQCAEQPASGAEEHEVVLQDNEDIIAYVGPDTFPRIRSWRARYWFAEEDANRSTIHFSELRGDFDTGGLPRVWDIDGCPPPFNERQEAVFRGDGTYSDTGLFRGARTRFALITSKGKSFVRFGPRGEFCFQAVRSPDWSWMLFHADAAPLQASLQDQGALKLLPHFTQSTRDADEVWESKIAAMAPYAYDVDDR